MWREEHCKEISLACVGSAHSEYTTGTLGLSQLTVACAFWIYADQAPGFSAGELSKVGPAFLALPRSKPLRFGFLGTDSVQHVVLFPSQVRAAQATRGSVSALSRWAVCLNHLLCPTRSVSRCTAGVLSQVFRSCDPPGRCQPARIPGRHG